MLPVQTGSGHILVTNRTKFAIPVVDRISFDDKMRRIYLRQL